jgi:thiamine transport system substrate-binding protein
VIRRLALVLALLALVVGAVACGGDDSSSRQSSGGTVTLMTHDSFAVSKPVLQAFEQQTGIKVKLLKAGDAGAELNQAILTKDHPLADALFGVDNTFLGRALANNIFVPYTAKGLGAVDTAFVLDAQHRVTPIDHGDICLNYDTRWFGRDGHPPAPASLDDLVKPAYRGLTVVENPSTSSPGLGFLLTSIAKYGEPQWQNYWAKLRSANVLIDDGWEQAYDGDFTVSGGKRPIVVSYASSPPADVVYSNPHHDTPNVGVVYNSCFRQVEFVGVLRGAKHPELAKQLVDFMISDRFQRDVPLQMYVYPVRRSTPLPAVFVKWGKLAPHPYTLSAAEIAAHRDAWIKAWTNVVS